MHKAQAAAATFTPRDAGVDGAAAQQALGSMVADIRQSLADAGLELGEFTVDLDYGAPDDQHAPQPDARPGRPRQQRSGQNEETPPEETRRRDIETATARAHPTTGLDVYA